MPHMSHTVTTVPHLLNEVRVLFLDKKEDSMGEDTSTCACELRKQVYGFKDGCSELIAGYI